MRGLLKGLFDGNNVVAGEGFTRIYKKRTLFTNLFFVFCLGAIAVSLNFTQLSVLSIDCLLCLIFASALISFLISLTVVASLESDFKKAVAENKDLKDGMKTVLLNLSTDKNISYYKELKELKQTLAVNEYGIWTWDLNSDEVLIDRVAYKLLEQKENIFCGGYSLFLNFFDKASRRRIKKDIAYALKFNTSFETPCGLASRRRKENILVLKGNVVVDKESNSKKIHAMLLRHNAPQSMEIIKDRFMNQSLALFAVLDKDFNFEFLNPYWTEITGYSMHELKKYPIFNFLHRREKRLFLNKMQLIKNDNVDNVDPSFRQCFRHANGEFIDLEFNVVYEKYRYYLIAKAKNKISDTYAAKTLFSFSADQEVKYLKF